MTADPRSPGHVVDGSGSTPVGRPAPRAQRLVAGALAIVFGLATLAEGGHVLFGGPEARAEAGRVVPFVLYFNFGAAFAYVAAGAGALLGRAWAVWIARALAATTVVVFVALGAHVLSGGAFEPRTPVAMTIRSVFWIAQAIALGRISRGGSLA